MTANVFTYGSLMFPEVWTRVVSGRYRSMPARLDGHARFEVRDETYPAVVAQPDSRVDGVLYLDVDDADLARLDDFEGGDYSRASVAVVCEDGGARAADVYLYRVAARLLPSPWNAETFAMDRFLQTYCRDKLRQ